MIKYYRKLKLFDHILFLSVVGLAIIGIIVYLFQFYPKYVHRVCTEESIEEEVRTHIPRPYTYMSCRHNYGIFQKGDDAPLAPAPY